MLIAVGYGKGSPGATTLGLGLAAVWPRPDVTLVECDPAGGDLWARFGHHPEPGLSALAASSWEGPIPGFFRQRLSVGADAVLAIPGDGAAASVLTLVDRGLDALRQASTTATVIVDVGRVDIRSPALPLVAAADHVLLLSASPLAQQAQVGARLPWLSNALSGELWLVGVGGHRTAEVSHDLGLPVIGTVPYSRWGAGVLSGQLRIPNWRRLKLARAVRRIAVALCAFEPEPDPRPARMVVWPAAGRGVVPPAPTLAGRWGGG
ncbi:hypothetical protein EDC02_4988 [Micromonospora sp. Llam0]|uniref:hypothetical protein n=1 Tax=Micromonospora sp. Llam0 TaxID=2485143 RepID=UPI000F9D9E5B|nr:hypothetical protein [Micromonospora sp. Llam0]ROO62979.1 hypothetical protein EDC02_4988 [Micromonospora sp. Llam0]